MSFAEFDRLRSQVAALTTRIDSLEETFLQRCNELEQVIGKNKKRSEENVATLREEVYSSVLGMVNAAVDAAKTSLFNFINTTIETIISRYRVTQQ